MIFRKEDLFTVLMWLAIAAIAIFVAQGGGFIG